MLPQLPDPTGPLPLFKGVSADAALKAAVQRTSRRTGGNQADRDAWCRWVTGKPNVQAVVEAAWLLLALAFRQQDAHARALQARVFDTLAAAYASLVLKMSHISTAIWTQTIADAACTVLRQGFPEAARELQDPRLQQLLQQQIMQWVTGTLPSDAAASTALSEPQATQRPAGDVASTAQFSSTSTGPLLTAFMARQQSSRTSHGQQLLPASGPRLRRLTVPREQLKQQQLLQQQRELLKEQQAEDQLVQEQLQQQLQRWQLCMAEAEAATTAVPPASSSKQRQLGESAGDGGGRSNSHRSQAAACVAAANGAAEQYERSKRAAAAAAGKATKALQHQAWQLQRRQQRLAIASRRQVASISNSVAGWLTESSAGTTVSAASIGGAAAATDAQCKAQRQLLEGHLRAGEWRLAHAFNGTVHSRCLDLTAAAATQQHGRGALGAGDDGGGTASSATNTAPGPTNWQAIAGTAAPRFAGGSGLGNTAGGSIKIQKAAKAIVQDVQRMLAATSGC